MHLSRRTLRTGIGIATVTAVLAMLPAPAAAVALVSPDLLAASDSGVSNSDNYTNAASLTFTVGGTAADDVVQLYRGDVAVGDAATATGTSVELTDPSPPEGVFAYTAKRGEEATAALSVTVDRTVAVLAPDLAAASDTGRLSTDNITSTLVPDSAPATYVQSLSFSFAREANASIAWTRKINAAAPTAQTAIAAGATTPVTGSSLTSALASIPPTSGTYLFSAVQTDKAGNVSTAGTLTVTMDVTPPGPAVVDLTAASDSFPAAGADLGLTNVDNITSSTVGNLVFEVTTEPNALVDMIRDGDPVGAQTTADGTTGKATITDSDGFAGQASNMHGYVAQVADVAGNRNKAGNLPVYVDTQTPGAATKLDLVTASDTGSDDGDDITKDNTPTFMVSGAEENALVELFSCPGAAVCTLASSTASGGALLAKRLGNGEITAPVTPDNSTVIVPPATVANTSWRFTVRQTDASGRVSTLFATNINVVIDTTPLATPSAPTLVDPSELAAAADTQSVAPTFNIATGSGRVELLRDGVVIASRTGAGNVSDRGPLSNGTYFYTARSVDTAGNESPESAALELVVKNGGGYWLVGSDGGVFTFGDAGFFGSLGDKTLNAPVLGLAPTPTRDGYWAYASDGGVFTFGDAGFFGSTGSMTLNKPIVGMVATASGKGYYLFAGDGGVFTFGDAVFRGTPASSPATAPIVAMALTPDGAGYWLVDSTGKIFGYGSAASLTGISTALNAPVVGMAVTPSGNGLWLVAGDGGVFAVGDARFFGSTGGMTLNQPIIGMVALPAGDGYYLYAADGGVFIFGNAPYHGSTGSMKLNALIVGMAAS